MLASYEFVDGFIQAAAKHSGGEWLDLSDPTDDEVKQVQQLCAIPDWFIGDALDVRERPHIDVDGNCSLIVVRMPVKTESGASKLFDTVPVGIIFSQEKVITVCRHHDFVRQQLSGIFQRKRHWTKMLLAFAVFHATADSFISSLEYMEDFAGEVETRLRKSARNEEILNLLDVQKSLIDTTVALKTNNSLMEKFTHPENFHLAIGKEEKELLDDTITENQQAIFMAEILNQTMSSMSDSFSSVISNNLNVVMKFLAGMTIVLMMPSIVAGFLGMNVSVPMAEHPFGFWWMLAISAGLMALMGLWFSKKKWI